MWKYIFPWCANPSWLCPGLARRAGPNKEWIWRIPCDEAARDPPRARSRHPGHHWTHHQVLNSQVNALPILPDLHRACVLNTLMSAFNHGWAFPIFATLLSLKLPTKHTRNKTPRVFVPNLTLLILGEVVNKSASGNLHYSCTYLPWVIHIKNIYCKLGLCKRWHLAKNPQYFLKQFWKLLVFVCSKQSFRQKHLSLLYTTSPDLICDVH